MDKMPDMVDHGTASHTEIGDGTIDGVLLEGPATQGDALRLTVGLPSMQGRRLTGGRYYLARCGAQTEEERAENWQLYLRRPLYVCGLQRQGSESTEIGNSPGFDRWELFTPQHDDPGSRWLRALGPGETVNLIGPLGNGFTMSKSCRNLLVLAEAAWLQALLPAINEMLDSNGRVTAIILHDGSQQLQPLLASLPIAVEVHLSGPDETWRQTVTDTVRWADQIFAAIPPSHYPSLAETIRHRRFRLEEDYAQMLVRADLACGYGGCLACIVPTANGSVTRACVHGPVLDLARLVV